MWPHRQRGGAFSTVLMQKQCGHAECFTWLCSSSLGSGRNVSSMASSSHLRAAIKSLLLEKQSLCDRRERGALRQSGGVSRRADWAVRPPALPERRFCCCLFSIADFEQQNCPRWGWAVAWPWQGRAAAVRSGKQWDSGFQKVNGLLQAVCAGSLPVIFATDVGLLIVVNVVESWLWEF